MVRLCIKHTYSRYTYTKNSGNIHLYWKPYYIPYWHKVAFHILCLNKDTILTSDPNQSSFPEEATALDNIGSHYESIKLKEGKASVPVAANSEEVDKERTYESISDKRGPMSDAATQQQCRKPVMSVAPVVATHVSYPGSPKAKSESQHAEEIYQNMSSPEPILARELERYIRKKKNGEMNELYHEFDVSCNHYIKKIKNIIS